MSTQKELELQNTIDDIQDEIMAQHGYGDGVVMDRLYAAIDHDHTEYAKTNHTHNYANKSHLHSEYAYKNDVEEELGNVVEEICNHTDTIIQELENTESNIISSNASNNTNTVTTISNKITTSESNITSKLNTVESNIKKELGNIKFDGDINVDVDNTELVEKLDQLETNIVEQLNSIKTDLGGADLTITTYEMDRPPTKNDDSNSGYNVGNYWRYRKQYIDTVYECLSSTTENAHWKEYSQLYNNGILYEDGYWNKTLTKDFYKSYGNNVEILKDKIRCTASGSGYSTFASRDKINTRDYNSIKVKFKCKVSRAITNNTTVYFAINNSNTYNTYGTAPNEYCVTYLPSKTSIVLSEPIETDIMEIEIPISSSYKWQELHLVIGGYAGGSVSSTYCLLEFEIYSIKFEKDLYLYKNGDEKTSITGGWNMTNIYGGSTLTSYGKGNEYFYITGVGDYNNTRNVSFTPAKKINFTNVKAIEVEWESTYGVIYNYVSLHPTQLTSGTENSYTVEHLFKKRDETPRDIYTFDVSNITGEYYLYVGSYGDFMASTQDWKCYSIKLIYNEE